jgi:hypothetical protein
MSIKARITEAMQERAPHMKALLLRSAINEQLDYSEAILITTALDHGGS